MISIKQIPTNLLLISAVLTLFMASCGGDDGGDGPPTGNGTEVEVVAFSPDSAYAGEEVQVQGLGFSPDQSENQVFFGGDTEATVDSVSLTEGSDSGTLITTVPDGATDGPIALSVNGGDRAESSSNFNVIEPEQQTEDEKLATIYWAGYTDANSGPELAIGKSYVSEQGRKFSEIIYNKEDVFGDKPPVSPDVYGLALDLNNEMMYWSNWRNGDPVIMRASLNSDASSIDTLYTSAEGVSAPLYLVLDLEESDIYWGDVANGIQKGSLDGSESVETVYSAGTANIQGGAGIDMMLDSNSDMLYWVQTDGTIVRAPKDGSAAQAEMLYGPGDGVRFAFDMMVSSEENRLLVSESQTNATGGSGRILIGSPDGSQPLEAIYEGRPEIYQSSISYDEQRDFVYWRANGSNANGGIRRSIMRGSLDGSSEVEVAYDLREFGAEYGTLIYGIAVAPDESSAKAKSKGNSQIPPIYLKF